MLAIKHGEREEPSTKQRKLSETFGCQKLASTRLDNTIGPWELPIESSIPKSSLTTFRGLQRGVAAQVFSGLGGLGYTV